MDRIISDLEAFGCRIEGWTNNQTHTKWSDSKNLLYNLFLARLYNLVAKQYEPQLLTGQYWVHRVIFVGGTHISGINLD
jgi:hypothetical protein